MKTNNIYKKQIELETTCVSVTIGKWDKLMEKSVKANGSLIRFMIKKQLPELYLNLALQFHNPFENQSVRTQTHLIYNHSGIEYFFKIY